jgi:predicted esterase
VLGGCGPGAALALLAGRTYSKPLAGIACIGGWLLRPADDAAAAASSARPPVLLCHAEEDDEVPMQLHYAACSWLRKRGHEVTAHQTPTLDLSLPLRRSLSLSLSLSLSPTLNLSLSLIQP